MISVYPTLPPTTFRTVDFAPCPVCGKTAFNHPKHRRNHIAKCEAAALDEMQAAGVFECEEIGLDALLPAPMVAAAHHGRHMEDPAPRPHYIHAVAVQAAALRRLVDFLDDADLERGVLYHKIDAAEEDLDLATDTMGDDDPVCERVWAIRDALSELRRWQRACEGDEDDAPDWTWDREVERGLADALVATEWLQHNRPVHPDSARWTQGAWDAIDAAVRQGVAA